MTSLDIRERTRQEWRELGFFIERNDGAKAWRLIGSRSGLFQFRDILVEYANDPRNDYTSEHEHYGPHFFEIMTWPEAGIDDHAVHGTLTDLKRLAAIVENRLAVANAGDSVRIQDKYAANTPYGLILVVREDGFDPAQADPTLATEGE